MRSVLSLLGLRDERAEAGRGGKRSDFEFLSCRYGGRSRDWVLSNDLDSRPALPYQHGKSDRRNPR